MMFIIKLKIKQYISRQYKRLVASRQFLGALMLAIGISWTFIGMFVHYEGKEASLFVRTTVSDFVKPGTLTYENPAHIEVARAAEPVAVVAEIQKPKEIKTCADAVEVYGKEYGNAELLGRIVKAESGHYDFKASSKTTTARGCAQFVIGTWEQYGKEHWGSDFFSKSVYSPKDNVELAAWAISTKGTSDWDASRSTWAK